MLILMLKKSLWPLVTSDPGWMQISGKGAPLNININGFRKIAMLLN